MSFLKMKDSEYFAIDAISASLLKRVYNKEFFEVLNKTETPESDAMKFGTLIHCLVLEPEEFKTRYAVLPELNLRTKEGKEAKVQFELENKDKEIITQDDHSRALNCLNSLIATKVLDLFQGGLKELVVRFKLHNQECKSKIDFYNEKKSLLIDLKTTCKNGDEFLKDCKKLHYNLQMAFYVDALRSKDKEVKKALIVGVQNREPYKITVVELEEFEQEIGREKYNLAFKMLEKIKKENEKYSSFLEFDILGNNIFKLTTNSWELRDIEDLKYILGENDE